MAPPRNFLYPSLVLLLTEEPRHGYRLVDALLRLGFGPVDRPSVYRALSELEGDGLLRSWADTSDSGATRQVYAVTDKGAAMLGAWMNVIREEHSCLGGFIKRYESLLDEHCPDGDAWGLGQPVRPPER
ncbi:MAG: helix-turn-helix transcriptional regulator [Acidimicrobiales bacterium]